MIEDRPIQNKWINETLRLIRAGADGIVQYAATGFGKTEGDVRVAKAKVDESNWTVTVFVNRDTLADQWVARFCLYGIDAGRVDGDHEYDPSKRVQVCMVQTICARIHRPEIRRLLAGTDLAIFDEGHHCPAPQWQMIIELIGGQMLAPTATPWRTDGKGLGDCGFNASVSAPPPRELIRLKYLAPYKVFAPPMPELDLSSLKSLGGDWNAGDVQRMVDTEARLRQAMRWYTKFAGGMPAFGFASGIVHAGHMAEMFRNHGWAAAAVDGDTDGVDDILKLLGANSLQMVSSCQKLYEGTDVPAVAAVLDDSPTMSTQRYIQRVGRALRPHRDKEFATVVDLVGNVARHGMPCAERPWTLHGGVKGLERQVSPTCRCPRCWRVFEVSQVCPECGLRQLSAKGASGPATVWNLPGIPGYRPEQIAAMQVGPAAELAKSRRDLQRIAAIKGLDAGWVDRIAKHRGLSEVAA